MATLIAIAVWFVLGLSMAYLFGRIAEEMDR